MAITMYLVAAVWAAVTFAITSSQNVERVAIHVEYHNTDENAHKHWSAVVVGQQLFIRHGRLDGFGRKGTNRREKPITFSNHASAKKDLAKRVRAKLRKGYVRIAEEASS